MTKKDRNMIAMSIRKAMPDTMTLAEKAQLLENMADEYRKKSRDDVHSDAAKFRAKTGRVSAEDYSPIIDKADGDEKSKS
jgi:hypothetical protein